MPKGKIFAGTTGVMLNIFVQDTSSTTGAGLAIAHNTAGLVAEYRRRGQSSWTPITLVAGTLGTFVSGGLVADGALTGAYEFCPPDAAFASGARRVAIRLRGAANMLPLLLDFELDAVDYQNATNFGLSDLATAKTNTDTLLTRLNAARAGYLDYLNISGFVASQMDIVNLNQSASRRIILQTVGQYERPESGSTVYTVEARTYDGDGVPVNADSNPTLTATGQTTGSLNANIGAITNPNTGVYRWTYSVASGANQEPIRYDVSATVSGTVFSLSTYTQVVDFVSAVWTTSDATKLNSIYTKLPSKAYLAGTTNADGDIQMDEATGNYPGTIAGIAGTLQTLDALDTAQDAQHSTTQTSLNTLLTRIPATLFSGITYLSRWLGALAGKTADASTLAEIQATQAGAGYSNLTDSLEAIRDRGDAAWTTGTSGGSIGVGQYTTTVTVTTTTAVPIAGAMVTVQLNNVLHAWGYTNNAGQIIFNTDPGNYTFLFSAPGFISGVNPRAVSGNNSFTAQMIAIPINPPPAAGLCTVAMKVVRGATAVVGAEVSVRLVDTRSAIPDGALPHLVASFTSNAQGEGTLVLPWSASILFGKGVYRVQIKDPLDNQVWHDREFTVPSTSTANYMDLPNA